MILNVDALDMAIAAVGDEQKRAAIREWLDAITLDLGNLLAVLNGNMEIIAFDKDDGAQLRKARRCNCERLMGLHGVGCSALIPESEGESR